MRPRQRRVRVTLIATSLLVFATVIGIAVMNRPSIEEQVQDSLSDQSGALQHDSTSESESANSDDEPSATWHDDVGGNILELNDHVNVLKERASRLWENDISQQE